MSRSGVKFSQNLGKIWSVSRTVHNQRENEELRSYSGSPTHLLFKVRWGPCLLRSRLKKEEISTECSNWEADSCKMREECPTESPLICFVICGARCVRWGGIRANFSCLIWFESFQLWRRGLLNLEALCFYGYLLSAPSCVLFKGPTCYDTTSAGPEFIAKRKVSKSRFIFTGFSSLWYHSRGIWHGLTSVKVDQRLRDSVHLLDQSGHILAQLLTVADHLPQDCHEL